MILRNKDTNTYDKNNAEGIKWLNKILIDTSTDALNIQVNEKFDLLPIIEQGDIVRPKIMIDDMLLMYEEVVQALHTCIKHFPQEGSPKKVGEKISLLMLHFLACSVHLLDVDKPKIEATTNLLEGLTKC